MPKAAAQSDKYSKMAPVDQYLMERNAEILLARSAAPDSISSDKTIPRSEEPSFIELVNAKTEDTSFKVEASVRPNRRLPTVSKKQKKR